MKIAIVEDDINMRKSLEIALAEYEEFEVVSFKSAKDALKKLDDSIDLVITDINMPQMDGIEFLRTLNGRYEALIITGNATLNKAIDSIRLGVKDFLTKPFDIETLVEAIHRAKKAKEIITKTPKKNMIEQKHSFIATSPALQKALNLANKAAKTDASVLLLGESGVGKELFANYISTFAALCELINNSTQPKAKNIWPNIDYTPEQEITEEQNRQTIVSLYFINKETKQISPEARLIDITEIINNPYERLVTLLIEGPKNEKLEGIIPNNTKVLKTYLEEDCVVIDFSKEFLEYNKDKKELLTQTITSTLTELTEVNKVKILIQGEVNDDFKDIYSRKK